MILRPVGAARRGLAGEPHGAASPRHELDVRLRLVSPSFELSFPRPRRDPISQTRMAEPKMASGRVASPGDSFQGEMLPPIQATHHLICRDFTGATGLEPATSGVTGRRSNQLNYAPVRAAV